ncbi:MAG: membrane dipeptidase [Chloroflexota bacterium]
MTHLSTARQLHEDALVIDAHHDILMDIHARGPRGRLSADWAPRLRDGGVDVQVLPIFVEDRFLPEMGLREAFRMIEAALADFDADNSQIELATDATTINDIVARGKIAGVLALEGCDGLQGDPGLLRLLYRLGVRSVGLTWERRNAFADGTGQRNPGGLTRAGETAIRDMADHSVLLDVSHLAEPGFWGALDLVNGPVIASHSNARAVLDHPRNLTDDQIKALAATGGVIGLNFVAIFIDPADPTLERLADHAAHIANLVGTEHIGLGPDFLDYELRDLAKKAVIDTNIDPAVLDIWVPNCDRPAGVPHFTAKLLERGFTPDDVTAILGTNFMRVFNTVWS